MPILADAIRIDLKTSCKSANTAANFAGKFAAIVAESFAEVLQETKDVPVWYRAGTPISVISTAHLKASDKIIDTSTLK